jgi:hypothetical protein
MRTSGPLSAQRWWGLLSVRAPFLIISLTMTVHGSDWMHVAGCEYFRDTLIKGSSTPEVVVVQRLCDGMASSDDMLVELVTPTGKGTTVFSFEAAHSFVRKDGEADPKAVWIDTRTLKITVGTVASIMTKRDHVGDIRIQYQIGSVMFQKQPAR